MLLLKNFLTRVLPTFTVLTSTALVPVYAAANGHGGLPTQDEMNAAVKSVAAAQSLIQELLGRLEECSNETGCDTGGGRNRLDHGIPNTRHDAVLEYHPENDVAAQFALLGMSVVLNDLAEKVDAANAVYGQPEFVAALANACVAAHEAGWKNSAARVSASLPNPGIVQPSDFDDPGAEIQAVSTALHCL